jgi:hypothetical protein
MLDRGTKATSKPRPHKEGERLYCPTCGSEIEIITPCTGASPGQVFQCCGQDMKSEVGCSSHLDSDG